METLTIRTASSTEVVKIASVGPQGPKGDKGDPGDVAGLPLSTQGDLLYRGASENQRLPIGTSGQVLKVSGGIPSWANESGAVTSVNGATGAVTVTVPSASSTTPAALGTAAVGSASTFARADHVHAMPNVSSLLSTGAGEGDLPVADGNGAILFQNGTTWAGQNITAVDVGAATASHVHGNLSNDGKVGSISGVPLKTGTAGVVEAGAFGTSAGTFCEGNDARLSDARTPTSHTHPASAISDSTSAGRALLTGADSSAQRTSLGLGTLATQSGTFSGTSSGTNTGDQTITLTGDVTGSGTGSFVTTIAANAVTNADLAQVATSTLKGRATAATGNVEDLTASQARTILNVADGATANSSDATLLSRANHTGTQAVGTITGLGGAATLSVGTTTGTVAAGNDSRITGAIQSTLVDAKGDLIVATAADTVARLPVGATNGHVLTVDSAEAGGMKWAAASGGIGGSTGSTDNAILRADGTGGSTSQSSALVIEDEVRSFTGLTGDAAADTITINGSGFSNGQKVRFSALTGGSGLNTTTNYFVINVSGDTFQLSTIQGGAASLFTTNITAGTLLTDHAVQTNLTARNNSSETNSSLVLITKGNGAFIVRNSPIDGSAAGGNLRGNNAIDIQPSSGIATRVASGSNSIAIGENCTASNSSAICIGGGGSVASGDRGIAIGVGATAGATHATAIGNSVTTNLRGQFSALPFSTVYWSGQTTTNAATILNLDGAATNRFTIAASTALALDILLVARRATTQDKWLVARRFLGIRRDGSNNTALIGAVQTLGTDQSAGTPTWTFALTADDTNEALQLEVTGATSETVEWRATAFYRVA